METNKKYVPIHCFNRAEAEAYGLVEALLIYAIRHYRSFTDKRFRDDFPYLKLGEFENAITHLMMLDLINAKQNNKGGVTFTLIKKK